MDLRGKTALIAGGARMGVVVGQALAREGCQVGFTWRNSQKASDAAVQALAAQGFKAAAFRCDVSSLPSIENALSEIQKQFNRLDVIVNLASIYESNTLDPQAAAESWKNHLEANAQSAYMLSLAAAPVMRKTGGGRIVHISDWTSASGRPRYADYSAYYVSKAAVKATVEVLALSLAPDILINAIAPGPILPPPGMSEEEQQAVSKATPLGRWGGAEEIAKAVLFLTQTDFVTGETLRVDGGRHLN